MKRCYKRTLAVLLALALCCQLLPISALADENELISPKLIVRGRYGYDVTYGCTAEWKNGDEVLSEPIAVEAGTTLSYTVTPTDELAENGVLYYAAVSGEVTLTEPDQQVEVYLVRLGTVTVKAQNQDYDEIPIDENGGYTALWYEKDGEEYVQIGEGLTSPLRPVESTVYCDVTMTGRNAEIYPAETKHEVTIWYYGNYSEWITFTTDKTASPVLTVTGYEGVDLTGKVNVVWRDRGWNELEPPYTVPAGSWIRYTVTPKNVLKIGGVQYYKVTTGEVQLLREDQAVNVELGMQGTVTIKFVDKKTGEEIPMDGDDGWSVQWYHDGYRDGGGDTSRMHDAGDEISCYLSLRGKTSTNYYNPGNVYYAVGFGNRTEIIDANIRVPELAFYTVERRVSQSGYLDVNRTDNGYTFESVFLNGEALVLDRDYVDTGYRVAFKPEYLASLGCGTHVFTVHYKETTEEDNYDTQLTVNLTKGDLNEVVFQSRANTTGFPNFYYNGEPKTLNPLLYVGSWANDQRMGMLREGVDYEIAYENNINATTDDNLAKAIFTGIGDYEGSTMVKEFKIKPCEINTGYADFEVVPNWDWPHLYDGTPKDMTDVSVYSRGKLLTEGVDYEISYQTWKDMPETVSSRIGSPTETVEVPIVIQGIGNYTSQWNSQSDYGTKVQYRIMPHVEESVGGTLVLNPGTDNEIPWTWQLDPDGLLTVSGEGEMPAFSAQYWLGGSDPDHYYFYGWRHGYSDFVKRAVVIGNVTRIESNAFDGCTNLVEAILPESVEVIGGSAFGNCRSLKTVHAPDSIRLPESLHTVESAMYYGCFGINTYNLELHLPDNITSYGLNSVPSSNKLYCRYGTTTHETLKAMGASGKHIVEGWDNYLLEYQDNYNLGGTYTVYGYVGHGGEERLPDFIDSITHYDIFGNAATLITKLTIPGNIRVLNGDAFRFLDNCTEIVIEPGAMESLIQGLLYYHPETVLTIPDTVTTMPGGDFSGAYYGTTLIVGEGSAALEWAIEKGYVPDDGSGYGKMYRVVKNVQPYVTPLTATVPSDAQEDVSFAKNDGDFTFDSMTLGETALASGSDYKVEGDTVTLKAAFVKTLEIGTHEIRLHYTGLAGENNELSAIDPVFKLTVVQRCRPVLTVLDKDGQDVTAHCTVLWKNGNTVLDEPISVAAGTTLTYTVTPNEELKLDGVQYYKFVTDSVRLTQTEQPVQTSLRQLGSVSVTPTFAGEPIDEGWTVRWFVRSGSGYSRLADGDTSPLVDVGKELFYDVILSGENALDYVNVNKKSAGTVVFGNTALEVALQENPTRYDVRFYLNGGTESEYGSCRDQSIQRNHEVVLPVAPFRRGYVFCGWKANYDGAVYQPGEAVIVKQSIYFYAQWTEKNALTLSFEGLGLLAGPVSLVGVTDSGEEVSIWGMNRGVWEQEPVTLPNHYRNDHTLVSLVFRGRVDGATVELARYDDPDGDLYNDEGTLTLTRTGTWTAVTEVQVDGMEAEIDYRAVNWVYNDPYFSRYSNQNVPFLTDGTVTYYVRFNGVPESENYTNHDWTKVYTLTLTDGVLHAAVDEIAPELWTGTVVFGTNQVPVANAEVRVSQNAYGLNRAYSAVTDENGVYTVAGFPDVRTKITVTANGSKVFDNSYEALSQELVLSYAFAKVHFDIDFDGVFDEALRSRIAAAMEDESLLEFWQGDRRLCSYWLTATRLSTETLTRLDDLEGITWSYTGKYVEPDSGTLTFQNDLAKLESTQVLKAGVLVSLNAEITVTTHLAWFDAEGSYLGCSKYFYVSSKPRDYLEPCPNEDGGTYQVALLPYSVINYLTAEDKLADIPESWRYKEWTVTLAKNEIKELEAYSLPSASTEAALYVTQPNSTVTASQESFTSLDDLIRYTGHIGLDPEMKNGKLTKLHLATAASYYEFGYDDAGTVIPEYLVINGEVYSDFSYGHGNRTIEFRTPIELPVDFTLYAKPMTTDRDMVMTVRASGSYRFGADHDLNFSDPVGDTRVTRPGGRISTLSTYLCSDTVTVRGTALKNETVTLYDGEVEIGAATADGYGDWEATVPLYGTGDYLTLHVLTAETASGKRSEELRLWHDPNGPELKTFRMYTYWYEVEPGGSYGSTQLNRGVTFKALIANPEALRSYETEPGGEPLKVVFRAELMNGEVLYLHAAYNEETGLFEATKPDCLNSPVIRAEVMYNPILHIEELTEEEMQHMQADETQRDEINALIEATKQELMENTAADSYHVDFTYEDGAAAAAVTNGTVPEETLETFRAAAQGYSEAGVDLKSLGVEFNDEQSMLAWLKDKGECFLTDKTEGLVRTDSRTLNLSSTERFERELLELRLYADRETVNFVEVDGRTLRIDYLIFTDMAEADSGTYFAVAQAIADEESGVYVINLNMIFTPDFEGFEINLTTMEEMEQPARSLHSSSFLGDDGGSSSWTSTGESFFSKQSTIHGVINGTCDSFGVFHNASASAGNFSAMGAIANQAFATYNYFTGENTDAINQGEGINNVMNSSLFGKAMNWLNDMGMDDPSFDDGGLYSNLCGDISDLRNHDFSGEKSGWETASFAVGTFGNAAACAGLVGLSIAPPIGLAITVGCYWFGDYASERIDEENAARNYAYNRFMNDAKEAMRRYAEAHPEDEEARRFLEELRRQETKSFKPVFDPSGTVFEAVIENPIEGATAQLFYAIDADGNLVQEDLAGNVSQLVPASEVRDLIPDSDVQTTDENGRYAWFVPEGLWYVEVTCDGYESGSSNQDTAATVYSWQVGKNLLPVLPVQLNVNIPLVDKTAPYVTDALYTEDGVYITFSKYMGEDTVLNPNNYSVFLRHGGEGEPDEWDYTVESVEQGHVPDNLPDAGKTYTRTVLLRIDELQEGDVVHWTVNGNVRSYAGTRLGDTYKASGLVGAAAKLDAPAFYVDGVEIAEETGYVENGLALELRLPESASEIASAKIVYSIDGGESWKTYADPMPLTNNVDVIARVEAIGYLPSESVRRSFVLSKTLKHTLSASVRGNDGGDVEGLRFTLEGENGICKNSTVVLGGIAFFELPNGSYTLRFDGTEFYEPLRATVEVEGNSVIFPVTLTAIPCEFELTGWSWTGFTAAEATFTCKIHTGQVQTVKAKVTSVRTEPDCTQNGSIVYTATVVFEGYTYTDVKTEVLDATGHDWNAPSYRWAADNHSVTASRVCKHNASHTESETVSTTPTVTKPASCTAAGETTYSASFENSAFSVQTKTVADVPALGHKPGAAVTENSTAPDCTKHGGYDTVVYCSVCRAELSREHTELAPLGHDWNEGSIQAAPNCTKEGVRLYTCRRCGETKTEVISAVGHTPGAAARENETAASCTVAGGYDTVIRCTVCSAIVQSTHTELPAIGHSWNEPEYKWTDDLGAVTATHTCRRDASHVETETVQTVSETVKEATFDAEGEIRYTARFTNPAFPVQTQTVVIPKLVTQDNPFVDVEKGKFYYDAVLWAVYHDPQITTGTDETHFKPGSICTRAQIVAFLWRAKGCPTPKNRKNPFTDVKETAYYYDAILWAVEENITTGTSATTFGPKKDCTRAQVVTFLWRAEGEPKLSGAQSNPFADVKSSAYYYTAVLWAVEKDITTGVNPTTFRPNGSCTRGQIVTFLHRDIAK